MRFISLCLMTLGLTYLSLAHAIELVTPEEALSSQRAAMLEADLTAPDPLAPTIQLIDPEGLDKPLKNPFRMEVLFKPQQGALLLISIKDNLGHTSVKEITFKVE